MISMEGLTNSLNFTNKKMNAMGFKILECGRMH